MPWPKLCTGLCIKCCLSPAWRGGAALLYGFRLTCSSPPCQECYAGVVGKAQDGQGSPPAPCLYQFIPQGPGPARPTDCRSAAPSALPAETCQPRPMPFNFPIFLTWLRVALIPVFVVLFYLPDSWLPLAGRNSLGALIFALAAVTDWLDGFLARKWEQTSAFGAFLDPVADKLIVAAALILLVELDRTQAWLAMVIIGREITISALREWMAQVGERRSVAVAYIGKLKTAAQMVAILLLLYWQPIVPGIDTPMLGNFLMVIAAILTLWSMAYYLQMAGQQLRAEKKSL